jgi:hypothetical protein
VTARECYSIKEARDCASFSLRRYFWRQRVKLITPETELDFIHLLDSPRRDAAEEYVKPTWKADFTYFPKR